MTAPVYTGVHADNHTLPPAPPPRGPALFAVWLRRPPPGWDYRSVAHVRARDLADAPAAAREEYGDYFDRLLEPGESYYGADTPTGRQVWDVTGVGDGGTEVKLRR